jgi:hypothetical protein
VSGLYNPYPVKKGGESTELDAVIIATDLEVTLALEAAKFAEQGLHRAGARGDYRKWKNPRIRLTKKYKTAKFNT